RDVEPQSLELPGGILSELSDTENSDGACRRVLLVQLQPDPFFLLRTIIEVLAMHPQNLKNDVFAHCVRHVRIDEADDRHPARAMGVAQDVVDPSAEREDKLEVRQRCQQSGLGAPDQRVSDLRRIADLRPYSYFEFGHQPGEYRFPASM